MLCWASVGAPTLGGSLATRKIKLKSARLPANCARSNLSLPACTTCKIATTQDADASAGEITAVNLEAHGVSQELRTLAASLTQRTFLDFPLAELEGEAKRAWRVRIWWRDGLPRAVRDCHARSGLRNSLDALRLAAPCRSAGALIALCAVDDF